MKFKIFVGISGTLLLSGLSIWGYGYIQRKKQISDLILKDERCIHSLKKLRNQLFETWKKIPAFNKQNLENVVITNQYKNTIKLVVEVFLNNQEMSEIGFINYAEFMNFLQTQNKKQIQNVPEQQKERQILIQEIFQFIGFDKICQKQNEQEQLDSGFQIKGVYNMDLEPQYLKKYPKKRILYIQEEINRRILIIQVDKIIQYQLQKTGKLPIFENKDFVDFLTKDGQIQNVYKLVLQEQGLYKENDSELNCVFSKLYTIYNNQFENENNSDNMEKINPTDLMNKEQNIFMEKEYKALQKIIPYRYCCEGGNQNILEAIGKVDFQCKLCKTSLKGLLYAYCVKCLKDKKPDLKDICYCLDCQQNGDLKGLQELNRYEYVNGFLQKTEQEFSAEFKEYIDFKNNNNSLGLLKRLKKYNKLGFVDFEDEEEEDKKLQQFSVDSQLKQQILDDIEIIDDKNSVKNNNNSSNTITGEEQEILYTSAQSNFEKI